ncbi:M23 family metallopeptidase [Neoroseomonas lacus]|nr:M23 family metallopeptidase [Neoroseomonas lacus]
MRGTVGAIRAWFRRAATEHVCPPPAAPLGPTPNRGVQRPLGLWWDGSEGQGPSAFARRALLATPALLLARPAAAVTLTERGLTQGGFVIGQAAPGTRVSLDGRALRVTLQGAFAFGFSRDQGPRAALTIIHPDNRREERRLTVAHRQWQEQRINGLPPAQVTPDPETLQRILREREKLAAVRAVDSPLTGFTEGFIAPAQGRISGVYGSRRILNGQPRQPHYGLDFAVPTGTPLKAVAPGRVTLADSFHFFGNLVVIDHGHGVNSLYAHLSAFDVREGQMVTKGEPVARSGATGRVTGPHLHFSFSWFETFLDPQPVVLGA